MSSSAKPPNTSRPESRPLVGPGHTFSSVTQKISAIVLSDRMPRGWLFCFAIGSSLVMLLLISVVRLFAVGVGIWGVNVPVGWGLAIVNFVWWIGIGHAGTLISAVLLLFHQQWRTSINRFAEAMTLFAVACAGLFPLLHLGRPWLFYWMFPYPATTGVWPQFRSPLIWDFFAVGTYATVSLMFWYVGLIPDLATLRDRTSSRPAQLLYGFLAMGWRGSARHWRRHQDAYLLLAGLATPLVVSVHSIVSFDFATGIVPGWHSTVFPPYFVAGAIYSGFAMVLTLAIPLRVVYGLQDFVTNRHLDNMAKVMLSAGLVVAYGYLMETFMAWYSGNLYEHYLLRNRSFGPYGIWYWLLLICNLGIPQLLWLSRVRLSPAMLFALSLVINLGMWLERFVIVVVSLHRDYLPSSWEMYYPTFWDWTLLLGTIGLFATLLLLFIRFLPMISIAEMRELLDDAQDDAASEPNPTVDAMTTPESTVEPVEKNGSTPALPATVTSTQYSANQSYGLLVQFATAEALLGAAKSAYQAGYRRLDAYSPMPVHGLAESIGFRRTRMPLVVLIGGLVGCLAGYGLAYYCSAIAYPLNIGGRPLNSWPAFIPVTFEVTILLASLSAVFGMLALNGLPRPNHPMFDIPAFDRVTQDRFFLCVFSVDPKFNPVRTRAFLAGLSGQEVIDVPG